MRSRRPQPPALRIVNITDDLQRQPVLRRDFYHTTKKASYSSINRKEPISSRLHLIADQISDELMTSTYPPITLSLNAFVKLYCLDGERKGNELFRRLSSAGGYDYYHTLTAAIAAHVQNKTADEIRYIINSSQRPQEVEHNSRAYNKYFERFGNKKGLELFKRKSIVKLADGKVQIVVQPLFSHTTSSESAIYHIWPSKEPILDRSRAGLGCYLLSRAFPKSNEKFKILDLAQGKIFSTFGNATASTVEVEAKTIALWMEQHT